MKIEFGLIKMKRNVDECLKSVLNHILDNGCCSKTDIMYKCNFNSQSVQRYLKLLLVDGYIRKEMNIQTLSPHNITREYYYGYTITRDGVKYILENK
jgi:predicted transcriptional regulator